MRNYFQKRTCGAPLQLIPAGFVPLSLSRQCIAILAVAEGWLLLDIGRLVFFLLGGPCNCMLILPKSEIYILSSSVYVHNVHLSSQVHAFPENYCCNPGVVVVVVVIVCVMAVDKTLTFLFSFSDTIIDNCYMHLEKVAASEIN